VRPRARHLAERLKEIEAGKFEPGIEKLVAAGEDELSKMFYDKKVRDIEP